MRLGRFAIDTTLLRPWSIVKDFYARRRFTCINRPELAHLSTVQYARRPMTSEDEDDQPNSHKRRTMLGWLALVAKERREEADVKVPPLAVMAGVDPSTVYLFEKGARWPRKATVDRLIAVYAVMTDCPDGREIWQEAITRWRNVPGAKPLAPGQEVDGIGRFARGPSGMYGPS